MNTFTLMMLILGIASSIYLISSAMTRIISRKNNERLDRKLDNIQNKLDNLAKLG